MNPRDPFGAYSISSRAPSTTRPSLHFSSILQAMKFPILLPEKFERLADQLKIHPEDIEEHAVRGSGAGGQKINKTSSCIELRHVPTGVLVRVQKHREQSKNRASAYKLLFLKIEEKIRGKESENAKKIFKLRKQKQKRSKRAKEKMLQEKHHHSEIKEGRKPIL